MDHEAIPQVSDAVILWIFALLAGYISGIAGAFFMHVITDRERDSTLAKISADLANLKEEVGNHDSGIIGQLHRYSKAIVKLSAKIGVPD